MRPEVWMRPYRIEEVPDEDEEQQPRVVRVETAARPRATVFGVGVNHRPWTPRETELPAAEPREEQSPLTVRRAGLSRTHQLMIGSFVIVCLGMVVGLAMVRVWDDASRAVAALPPEGAGAAARSAASQPASTKPGSPVETPAVQGTGAITTEIRVLEPNYTVAPGDTLGIIARRHGTNIDALASINNLENRNSLSVGQKLIIP